jgi:MFS transporter, ACS family, aldohexuronate transporter
VTIPPPTTRTSIAAGPKFAIPHLRWYICALLFLGSTINYIDRGTIAILAPHLQGLFNWSENDYGRIVAAFQAAYAIMMLVSGPVIDWLGTRAGYAVAMAWWSVATAGHALARSVASFRVARFTLGAGEAGNFPASIKGVAEWFPKRERALATGIFNAGTNIGAVVAYPVVGWLFSRWGWQAAFIGTGSLGFLCVVLWLLLYRPPQHHPWITAAELDHIQNPGAEGGGESESRIPWLKILGLRQSWGFTLAKFMTDPIWWFYLFWLPKYLTQARGLSMGMMVKYGNVPFLAALVGSVAGGWLSGRLIRRGWSVNAARKTTMAICAFCMPAAAIAVFAKSPWVALAFISVATSAHQGWSANVFTLASDIFPKKDVASVVGIGGFAGAVGGWIIARVAGFVLQWFHSYVPLFIIASVMHPLAIGLLHLIVPRIEPVQST